MATHLETEELVSNFKFKYDELKYILENKVKEMQIIENNYQEVLIKLQSRLSELETANVKLKNIAIYKEKEVEELKRQNFEWKRRQGEMNDGNVKISDNKDLIIRNLEEKISKLEDMLREKSANTGQNVQSNLKTEDIMEYDRTLLQSLNETKEELETLKDRWNKKYSFIKEKYTFIKHQLNEKNEYIKILQGKLEASDCAKLEENYKAQLYMKDQTIQQLLNYKNIINDELKVIRQFSNENERDRVDRGNNFYNKLQYDYNTADNSNSNSNSKLQNSILKVNKLLEKFNP